MSKLPKKTASITVRTDESLKSALETLAAADDRKLSAYIVRVLREHVQSTKGRK